MKWEQTKKPTQNQIWRRDSSFTQRRGLVNRSVYNQIFFLFDARRERNNWKINIFYLFFCFQIIKNANIISSVHLNPCKFETFESEKCCCCRLPTSIFSRVDGVGVWCSISYPWTMERVKKERKWMKKIDRKGWLIGWWLYQENTHTTTTTTKKYIYWKEKEEKYREKWAHTATYIALPQSWRFFYFFRVFFFLSFFSSSFILPYLSLCMYFGFCFNSNPSSFFPPFNFLIVFLFFVFLLMERNEHLGGLFPRWPIDKRVESQITSRLVFCYVFLSISRLHDLSQHPIQTQNSRFRVTVVRAVYLYNPQSWMKEFILSQYNPKGK